MKKIGIIVAMDKEYEQLSKVFEGRTDIVLQKVWDRKGERCRREPRRCSATISPT